MAEEQISMLAVEELARLAQSSTTPPDVLEKVFFAVVTKRSPEVEKVVWGALAENPSTPPGRLAFLLPRFPGAFCRNPVASLLPLERPDFLTRLTRKGIEILLGQIDAPVTLLAQVTFQCGNPYFAEGARQHIALAGTFEGDRADLEAAIRASLLRIYAGIGEHERTAVDRAFTQKASVMRLRIELASADWLERLGAACSPRLRECPNPEAEQLLHDPNRLVRAAAGFCLRGEEVRP